MCIRNQESVLPSVVLLAKNVSVFHYKAWLLHNKTFFVHMLQTLQLNSNDWQSRFGKICSNCVSTNLNINILFYLRLIIYIL